tara:strand:- start:1023 stop:1946 length:924 start_codon:yes stop_codon:yes gene_type:complete
MYVRIGRLIGDNMTANNNGLTNPPKCELIEIQSANAVLTISLNREEVFNALNPQLIGELTDILKWSENNSVAKKEALVDSNGDKYFRAIILKGLGKHFCAGADINWMRDSGAQSMDENIKDANRLDQLFYNLWAHPCFTISLVQGVALGGGAGLVACVDHVIALEGAKIAMSEIKLGILPAVIGPYVYRKIGSAQFRRLAMLGSRIDTIEAQRIGLVNEIAKSDDNARDMIASTIKQILSSAPSGVYKAKQLALTLDRIDENLSSTSLDQKIREYTINLTSDMRGSLEGQEGLSSFLERRKPEWTSE